MAAVPVPRRVAELADGRRWVVLAAPSGYGTSTVARALADATGRPVVDRPARTLVTGSEPGGAGIDLGTAVLVVDDLHELEDDGAELVDRLRTVVPPEATVLWTTQGPLPVPLTRAVADGTATLVGPADLLLDVAACDRLAGERAGALTGAELRARSGGWAIVAALLARVGPGPEVAVVDRAVAELPADARELLAVARRAGELPLDVLDAESAGPVLRAVALRHPALVGTTDDGLVPAPLLARWSGAGRLDGPRARRVAAALMARGRAEAALRLLSGVSESSDELQACLTEFGPALVDAGRFRVVRDAVAAVPRNDRTVATRLLDAAARLGEADLRADPAVGAEGLDEELAHLADRPDLTADEALAVAGLRVELLRRAGDPRLAVVALEHLDLVGDVGTGVTATDLVTGRGRLGARGAAQLLVGLATAALFSGDADLVSEGRRLSDLAFDVADRAGMDPLPLRAQAAYDRTVIGLDLPPTAVAPLEAGIAALQSRHHPRTANLLIQLADVHVRNHDLRAATDAAAAAARWAEDTGNEQVRPGIRMVEAAVDLVREGPSADVDAVLEASWGELAAGPRLRRAAPGFALRAANLMLDHLDLDRAGRWIERARALLGERLQLGYQTELLQSLEARRAFLAGEPNDHGAERFAAQPAGRLEYRLTVAWDRHRTGRTEGTEGTGAAGEEVGDPVPWFGPWPARLGAAPTVDPTDAEGGRLHLCLLGPELVVRRDGEPIEPPRGQAARLLALLVVHDGALPIDAVMDALWPDTDAATARNRLHQLLLRLRRALGVDADGPVQVVDQVVRLDGNRISSDVAELRAVHRDDLTGALGAVDAYAGDLLSAQFAYDDLFADARWELRHRLVDLGRTLLRWPGADAATAATVQQVVRAAWLRLDDAEDLGAALTAAG